MAKTTLKITANAFDESLLVRCDLSQASSQIEVNYMNGESGWDSTQYQCADARHTNDGLAAIGARLLAQGCECGEDDLEGYEVSELCESIKLSDGNATESYDTIQDAAEAAAEWYEFMIDQGDIDELPEMDEFDGSDVDDLNSWISTLQDKIAESIGKTAFQGHGNYSVSAADEAGLQLTAEAVSEWK